MPWSEDQILQLGDAEEVNISSYRNDGSLRKWTPIWVVRVGNDLYVRSVRGADADWYRHASDGRARIQQGSFEADVTLERVLDSAVAARVGDEYRSKYERYPNELDMVLAEPAVDTTTRLVLAS